MRDDDFSSELKRDFQNSVNFYMCFKDKSVKALYESYAKTQVSLSIMISVCMSFNVFGFIYFIFSIIQSHEGIKGILFIFSLCFANFIAPAGLLIIYAKMNERNPKKKYAIKILPWVPFLETYVTVVSSMFLGFVLFCRTYAGICPSFHFIDLWGCNPQALSHALPQETLILLMLLPIVFSTVFRNVKWEAVFLSWIIIIFWIGLCIGVFEMYNSIYALIFYVPLSFAVLYENQRRYLSSFFLSERLRNKVRETELLATDYGTEVRHMMGNMTHDLKTPMSGFSSGLEGIEVVVQDCAIRFQSGNADISHMQTAVSAIMEAVTQLKIINNFMLVTVNRCIDYTKVSKGLKLVPRNETICVTEAMELPLHCMRGIQSRIEIVLLPLPINICSHIITDKQWLQENVLCLLSNAVKYSSVGRVTVKLSLISSESELFQLSNKGQLRRLTINNYVNIEQNNNHINDIINESESDRFVIDVEKTNFLDDVLTPSSEFKSAENDNKPGRQEFKSMVGDTPINRSIVSLHQQHQQQSTTNDSSFLRGYHRFDLLPISFKYPQKQSLSRDSEIIDSKINADVNQNVTRSTSTKKTQTSRTDETGTSVNRNNALLSNNFNTIRSNKSSFSNWFSTKGFSPQPVVVDTSRNSHTNNNDLDDYFISTSVKSNVSLPLPPSISDSPLRNVIDLSTLSSAAQSQNVQQQSLSSKSMKKTRQVPTLDIHDSQISSQLLLIEIEDSGIGISEAVKATLFTPFKQAQRLAGGTGLGLFSLAKRVEALNGYYGVRNRIRGDSTQGSNFWFAIPYKPDAEAANMERPSFVSYNSTTGPGIRGGSAFPPTQSFLSLANMNDDSPASPTSSSTTFSSSTTNAALFALSLSPPSTSRPPFPLSPLDSGWNLTNLDTARSTASNASTGGVVLTGLNILLVDDSASILKMTGMMLRRNNHKVTEAIHGADALEKLASARQTTRAQQQHEDGQDVVTNSSSSIMPSPFDVIIMDLQMPIMDGLECTTRLRKIESQQQLQSSSISYARQKVIVCSANSDEDTTRAAYAVGVDAFLAKPLTMKAFNLTYQKVMSTSSNNNNISISSTLEKIEE